MTAPTDDPILWGTDTNWTSGPRTGDPLKDATLTSGVAAQGIVGGQTIKADQINQALWSATQWVEYLRSEQSAGVYGDGSDGALAAGFGTLSMTRDLFYTDGELSATDEIITNGFVPHFNGTLTTAAGAEILADGSAGATGDAGGAGGAGALAPGGLGAGAAGGAGGTDDVGTAGTAATASLGGDGGDGGASNDGSPGASFTAGPASVEPTAAQGTVRSLGGYPGILRDGVPVTGGSGGSGGSGGDTGTGGGGGGGGGVLVLAARVMAHAGVVRAAGGAGGAGMVGPDANGNGGGGGGGGGVVILINRQLNR